MPLTSKALSTVFQLYRGSQQTEVPGRSFKHMTLECNAANEECQNDSYLSNNSHIIISSITVVSKKYNLVNTCTLYFYIVCSLYPGKSISESLKHEI